MACYAKNLNIAALQAFLIHADYIHIYCSNHTTFFRSGSGGTLSLNTVPADSWVRVTNNEPVAEFIDSVFEKISPKCLFSIIENERFGLVFAKTGSINLGAVLCRLATGGLPVSPVTIES